jgi:hypothetical protein
VPNLMLSIRFVAVAVEEEASKENSGSASQSLLGSLIAGVWKGVYKP